MPRRQVVLLPHHQLQYIRLNFASPIMLGKFLKFCLLLMRPRACYLLKLAASFLDFEEMPCHFNARAISIFPQKCISNNVSNDGIIILRLSTP